jgi:2-succinyl-6-hydroxy-2,4-cyclohexadiene-1-carboxylate synthase
MHLLINGINYHLDVSGQGSVLVLLHGFAGSSTDWMSVRQTLSAHATVIAPDLIGHGQTSAPHDPERYTMEHAFTDLLAILDVLNIGKIDLLGYSMGGRLALHLAHAAPQRIRRLILESASPGLADPAERTARITADEALANRIEREGIARFVEIWEQLPLFASQAHLPQALRDEQRTRRLRNLPHGLANSLRGMGTGRQRSLWGNLGELNIPTLLLTGELDPKFCAIGQEMVKLMPDARQMILPDAGHNLHLEQPQAFLKAVVRWLNIA